MDAFKAAVLEWGIKSRDPLKFIAYDEAVVNCYKELVGCGKRMAAEQKAAFLLEFSNVMLTAPYQMPPV